MTKVVVNTDEVLTIEEAAGKMKCGVATIWRRIKDSTFTPIKLSNRTYIPRSQVDQFLKDNPAD